MKETVQAVVLKSSLRYDSGLHLERTSSLKVEQEVENIPSTHVRLRNLTLGALNGLDMIKEASSRFDSMIVKDALDRLINVIIEVVMEISRAYSGMNKYVCTFITLTIHGYDI